MSSSKQTGDITTIPESIKRRIFSFLDYRGLITVSLVCHDFYQIAQHDELWKKEFMEEFGDVSPFIVDIENHPKEKIWKYNFISTCEYPGYEWDVIDGKEPCIEVSMPIPPGTRDSQIEVQLSSNTIKAGLKNQTPIAEGKLVGTILTNESNWTIRRDSEEHFDHLVLTLVPEDVKKYISSVPETQYNFINGPRVDGDFTTIDVLSKQILGENISALPMINPFQINMDYDAFENEGMDREIANKKIQAFLDAMMRGDMDGGMNDHDGYDMEEEEDYEHDIHEVDEQEAAEIQREQQRRKMEMEAPLRRSALRQSNKKFSIPDTTSGEFRLDGNPSNPPAVEKKREKKKEEGFRFKFDSKPKNQRAESNGQIVSQDGSILEPILASAQETYSNWKYQIWMGAALLVAFQVNSWLSK